MPFKQLGYFLQRPFSNLQLSSRFKYVLNSVLAINVGQSGFSAAVSTATKNKRISDVESREV